MTSWASLCYSVDLISGKTSKCFTFILWLLKSESLVTTSGFRVCVTTLPDDISIRTTKPLAAASAVKQKNISFPSKTNPNQRQVLGTKGRGHTWAAGMWWDWSSAAQPGVPSSCVSSPLESSWKWQEAKLSLLFTTEQCTPTAPRPLAATKTPLAQKHRAQHSHKESAGVIWVILGFRAGLMGTDSDWTELPNSCPSHQQKAEWSVKEYRDKLNSDCWGKTEIFVRTCRNSSSPRFGSDVKQLLPTSPADFS